MPSLREAKRQLARSRFAGAATAAFAAKPYSDVTVDDISRRAGTSRATFYLYYPDKLHALLDCLGEYETGNSELWEKFARIEKKTVASLEDWLESYIELYEKHKVLLGALHQAEAVEPALLDDVVARAKNTVARWQQLGVVSPEVEPEDDLELRVLLFAAQLQRFLYLWINQGISVNREKAIRTLAEQWYDIIAGARSPARHHE
jgi:AcrR family transcriptional regulator